MSDHVSRDTSTSRRRWLAGAAASEASGLYTRSVNISPRSPGVGIQGSVPPDGDCGALTKPKRPSASRGAVAPLTL